MNNIQPKTINNNTQNLSYTEKIKLALSALRDYKQAMTELSEEQKQLIASVLKRIQHEKEAEEIKKLNKEISNLDK